MTASVRTTTDGSTTSPPYRYTAGEPDGLNEPATGYVAGLPPFVWSTGGTNITANSNPAGVGMDIALDAICEALGFPIAQYNAPGFIGKMPDTANRIDDAVAWLRANRGATNDPPICMGPSGGWVNSNSYARLYPVTAVIGILPVVDATSIYRNDDFGFQNLVETQYGLTYNPSDPDAPGSRIPDGFDPYRDVEMWPHSDLEHKYWCSYSGNDTLYVGSQMAYGQRIGNGTAEYHNHGGYGHQGKIDLSNGGFDGSDPVAHMDMDRLIDFINERLAAL